MKPTLHLIILSALLLGVMPPARAQMTSRQAIPKMTRGFNFGRCLETDLENHVITATEMDDVKAAGFNFVRLPIQWNQHMGTNAPYTIDAAWLNRVQQIVDWAIARDLIILINSHHDTWIENDANGDLERFKALWTQVGARFQNHSDRLLFEIMNEPALSVQRVNTVDNAIFPIIRASNPTRIILFGGPGQSYNRLATCTYPANDNYLMGEIHNYDPWSFAGEGTGTWGTASDYQAVTNVMQPADTWSTTNNIPVVLGEYGTVTWCDGASRELYVKAMVSTAAARGFAPCVWHDYGWFNIYTPNNPASTRWSAVKDWIMAVTQPGAANKPPTLTAPGNISIHQSAGQQTVNLTGITSGSTNEMQALAVTAISSNPGLIPTPTVIYTSPNTNGSLTFAPVPYLTGAATITVTVDDGQVFSNLVSRSFTVTINPLPNLPFSIAAVSVATNTVNLSWASTAGKLYAIEYSLDLLTWNDFMTNIPAAGTNTSAILNLVGSAGTNELLVQYQMGQTGPQIQDANNTLAGGNLTKGAGLNLFDPNSSITYTTAPSLAVTFTVASTNLNAASTNQAWFTFKLTVGTNVMDLDLSSLTFNAARGGSGVPRGFAVLVTTPTTTNQSVQGDTQLTTQRTDWGPLQTVDLSAFASLQSLSAGQTVTFKIPVYSPAVGSSLDFDNLAIYGKSTFGSVPVADSAKAVFFRVRQ
jgi:aryl-phospho-beta-D-glucosidase BglC (GH1 family)